MLRSLFAVSTLVVLAGCATVTRGTTNQVQITSEPSGASVKTSLGHTCTTPCTLTIDRKQGFTATYTLAGYQEQSISVNTQTSGAGAAGMAGNILIGGVVGVVADAATGATLDHVPNPVHAVLVKAGPAPRGSSPRR